MEREAFRQRMQQYKQARENNPYMMMLQNLEIE